MRQIFGDGFSNEFFAGVEYPIGDDAMAPLQPRPFTIPTVKRYQPPRSTANKLATLSVGDGQKLHPPGESFALELRPQVTLQLQQLQLLQYPQGDSGGGTRCCWPIEVCFVGDRVIPGPMALYDGLADAPTCKVGQIIQLRLRNPLGVPAAICGSFIGRTYAGLIGVKPSPTPLSAADLECMVSEHKWCDDGAGGRTCARCGHREDPPQGIGAMIGSYVQPRPLTGDDLRRICEDQGHGPLAHQLKAFTNAQLDDMVRRANGDDEEPRCCCGERTVHRCQRCGEPRCSAHLHGSPSMCCMSDGLPEPGCAVRAAKLAKRCAICGVVEPTPWHGSVGWVYGAAHEAHCKACTDARGGADAFVLYRAMHDGAVPPVGSVPCVDCGTATPGYLVDAHAGGHCERCARKHRASPLVDRKAAGLPPAAVVPAKRGTEQPRRIIYCEAAPPRAVVEGTPTVLDGDECGGVPCAPFIAAHLCYSARQLVAWERHRDYQARWRSLAGDAADVNTELARLAECGYIDARADHDTAAPRAPDAYGGRVVTSTTASLTGQRRELAGYRCALCGAWLREVLR